MKLSIGSDHAGYDLKKQIFEYLQKEGHVVIDQGTYNKDSVDYPDFAEWVVKDVQNKEADYGILVCYTGIGMSMAANKARGIRAALVGKVEDAVLTREHNNANVLCLSAKNTSVEDAFEIIKAFLSTDFAGGRHERRVEKVMRFENEKR
jgi:ribose 5-phosphate isomerase B